MLKWRPRPSILTAQIQSLVLCFVSKESRRWMLLR
jgi:hypothetical protein